MENGLLYFEKVYDEVPGWVQKMHMYSSEALDAYTNLRSIVMEKGYLSKKEKDLFLVGINAARLYERSMIYHTKSAMDQGANLAELVEYLLVSYVYNGVYAWEKGINALIFALSQQDTEISIEQDGSIEMILERLMEYLPIEETEFIQKVFEAIESGTHDEFENVILQDGLVSSKNKYLVLAGIYMTELQGQIAAKCMETARELGASEEELAETGFICLLTAGIPAWFEASDALQEK